MSDFQMAILASVAALLLIAWLALRWMDRRRRRRGMLRAFTRFERSVGPPTLSTPEAFIQDAMKARRGDGRAWREFTKQEESDA